MNLVAAHAAAHQSNTSGWIILITLAAIVVFLVARKLKG